MGSKRKYKNMKRKARKYKRKYKRTKTLGRMGTTTQKDVQQEYRKRRGLSSKQKKQLNWERKVRNVILYKTIPSKMVRFQRDFEYTQQTPNLSGWEGTQMFAATALYTGYSTNSQFGDIYNIANNLTGVANQAQISFESAVQDLTITNTCVPDNEDPLNPYQSLEIDLYELEFGAEQNNNEANNPKDAFAISIFQKDAIPGFSALRADDRGVTPFQATTLIKDQKMRIVKKTTVQVPQHGFVTYQMKCTKRKAFDVSHIGIQNSWIIPNMTRVVLIIAKTVGNASWSVVNGGQMAFKTNYSNMYNFSIISKEEPQDGVA